MASRPKETTETSVREESPSSAPRRDDMHIAGSAELATAVEMAEAESDEAVANREEVDEMSLDASAALADGMGADDARTEALMAEPHDTRDAELRDDMDEDDKSDDEDEEEAPTRRTLH